ncbi:MAG: site-specific DNA-methyltransferase [Bacteroidales bacterium]
MDKMKFETPNLTAENVTKIAELFPGVVTEGKVNFDLLRSMLGDEVYGDEAYEFTWVGKRAAIAEAGRPIRKTLRPCMDESKDWDTTENLYIEGDNLDVLKLLQESYLGKIKMIYIDPPYNTGNDFIYRDNFAQSREEYADESGEYDEDGERLFKNTETNGRFHSDWCSMIYPRLVIARNVLSPDGVIFISIDDNEIAQLREICDEVFGESNFIGILSVENNPKGRKNSAFVSVSSEYCVIYAKSKRDAYFIENIPKKASDMTEDEDGNFVHGSGKRVLVGENSFNKYVSKSDSDKNYSVYYCAKDRGLFIKKEEYGETDRQLLLDGYVKYFSHNEGRLVENTYTENKFRELFEQRALDFSADKIYEKNFNDTIRIKSQLVNREYEAIVRGKKQSYSMELTTTGAGTYVKNLFQVTDSPFSASKNIGYLKILISLFENEPFIVLDFFSGSATTADAVMRLNAEDGGKRKFIMVQLPENLDENLQRAGAASEKQTIQSAISICDGMNKPHLLTEIGKERIRRAGDKIKAEAGLTALNLDIGFRVLKLDDTNMNDVYYAAGDYTQDLILQMESNIKPDRTDMDLLYGCLLEWGLPLSMPHTHEKIDGFTAHTYNDGDLIACFEERISEKAIREIASRKPLRAVFRDSSFNSSPEKINVFEIFKLLAPNTNVRVI